jgi:hypothetical protein
MNVSFKGAVMVFPAKAAKKIDLTGVVDKNNPNFKEGTTKEGHGYYYNFNKMPVEQSMTNDLADGRGATVVIIGSGRDGFVSQEALDGMEKCYLAGFPI